jgi:hypothetical protein
MARGHLPVHSLMKYSYDVSLAWLCVALRKSRKLSFKVSMKSSCATWLLIGVGSTQIFTQSTASPELDSCWISHQLINNFWAENATAGGGDRDGVIDVVYGPYWFAGPGFETRHLIYPDSQQTEAKLADGGVKLIEGFHGAKRLKNGYSDNFVAAMGDFNGDGWSDYLVIGFPGEETFWYENARGTDALWARHVAIDITDNESPMFVDVDGDGRRDLRCMSSGFLGYATYDPKTPSEKWTRHPITEKRA